MLLADVHVTQWEAAFSHKQEDFEKCEAQKLHHANCCEQGILKWESKHADNLIHMSCLDKQTVGATKCLAGLDSIPPSDEDNSEDEESTGNTGEVTGDLSAVHEQEHGSAEGKVLLPGKKRGAPPSDPYFLLPLQGDVPGAGSAYLMQPSDL